MDIQRTYGSEPNTRKRQLGRLRRVLLPVLLIALTLVLSIGIAFVVRQRAIYNTDIEAGKSLPQELAAARSSGLPTSAADLQTPMPPPAQNAASLYKQFGQELKLRSALSDQDELLHAYSHLPVTEADWKKLTKAYQDRAGLFTLIHQAASRPQCVFSHDWIGSDPSNVQFPELTTFRDATRLLTAQGLILAHQGRIQEAIRNQSLGFTVAQQAGEDKTSLAYLTETSCEAITVDGLMQIVTIDHGKPSTAASVQSVIESHAKVPSVSSALKWDMAANLAEIDYMKLHGSGKPSDDDPDASGADPQEMSPRARQEYDAVMDANSVYLLRQMRKAIAVADQPYSVSQPVLKKLEDDSEKTSLLRITHMIGSLNYPMAQSTALKRVRLQALINVDGASCAVLAARNKNGQFPAQIPGTFADPFTDKPLQYRREGKSGFVVYSAGPNGDFDGGKPGVKPKSYQTYFRYPESAEK